MHKKGDSLGGFAHEMAEVGDNHGQAQALAPHAFVTESRACVAVHPYPVISPRENESFSENTLITTYTT